MKAKIDVSFAVATGAAAPLPRSFIDSTTTGITRIAAKTLEVPAGMQAAARLGARSCPERAIKILED